MNSPRLGLKKDGRESVLSIIGMNKVAIGIWFTPFKQKFRIYK